MKSRSHPMITTMKRYNEWGIELNCPFQMMENSARKVKYADKDRLKMAVMMKYPPKQVLAEFNIDELEEPPARSSNRPLPLQDDLI